MSRGEDITTRFKVDISELKAGMQQAARDIKLANSEFKAAASGMDDWSKSSEGLEAKLKQLNAVLDAEKSKLEILKEQHKQVVAEQGANSKAAQELEIKINNQQAAVNKTTKEIQQYDSKLDELKKSADFAGDGIDDLGDDVDDLGDSLKKSSDGFTVLKGALADLLADGIRLVVDGFKELITASSEANAVFQAQTGASAEEMGKFTAQMEELYKANFGESMQDVANSMAQVKQQMRELEPDQIKNITQNALTLRDTFGYEVNESIRAVKMLMDQFGVSADEAFNLIVQGAQKGLDKNGDLLDSINEYSVHYEQLGFTADEFFNSLLNGADAGTFSVDKLGDAMKEFGIRVKEESDETAAAMEDLGLGIEETIGMFNAGGEDARTAMGWVVEALLDVENSWKRNEIGIALFGTMWEDLGATGVEALLNINGEIDKTRNSMEELTNVRYSDIGSQFAEIGRILVTDFLQPLANAVLPVVSEFLTMLRTWLPEVKQLFLDWAPAIMAVVAAVGAYIALTSGIELLKSAWKSLSDVKGMVTKAQTLLNAAMNANPIVLIVSLIAGLVAAFVTLWNTSESFRNFWIGLWENIKNIVSNVGEWLSNFFTKTLPDAFNSLIDWFKNLPTEISQWLQTAWETIKEWGANVLETIVETGSKFLESTIEFISQLPEKIGYWLGYALGTIAEWGVNLITWAVETFTQWIEAIVNFISQLPELYWEWLTNTYTKILEWGQQIIAWAVETFTQWIQRIINFMSTLPQRFWEWLTNTFQKIVEWGTNTINKGKEIANNFVTFIVNFIKELPGKLWNLFVETVNKVIQFGKDMVDRGTTAAKDLVSGIVSIVTELPAKMLEIGGNIVKGLWEGITSMGSWLKDKIMGFASSIMDGFKSAFGINSPSREMRDRIGQFLPSGLAEGIERNLDVVRAAANDMLNAATPDIPDFNVGSNYNGQSGGQSNITFNQYNNSPKALSRLEIYRQTKNQLRTIREVI